MAISPVTIIAIPKLRKAGGTLRTVIATNGC
jgi:hypothetical protein